MGIKKIFSAILFFISTSLLCQLSLKVRELNYDEFKEYVPDNDFVKSMESQYKGHIFEISLINNTKKTISLPLDTLSYALPYTEDIWRYYKGEDFRTDPDLFNVLGVHPFLFQKNKFIDKEFDMPYHLNIILPPDAMEKNQSKTDRLTVIKQWKEKNKLPNDLYAVYNWYLLNNMVTINPKATIKYRIYFNPFLKRQNVFDYHEFYTQLDAEIPYEANFKIILNKNLYKFLTKEDKLMYPDLFTGVVTSETLDILTNSNK